jgi:hypothetical protein
MKIIKTTLSIMLIAWGINFVRIGHAQSEHVPYLVNTLLGPGVIFLGLAALAKVLAKKMVNKR